MLASGVGLYATVTAPWVPSLIDTVGWDIWIGAIVVVSLIAAAAVSRRRSRADWVQQQSRAVVESLFLPPAIRNAAFRERGDQEMHDRYAPLIPAP